MHFPKRRVGFGRAVQYYNPDAKYGFNEKGLAFFSEPKTWKQMRALAPAGNSSKAVARLRNSLVMAEDQKRLFWNRKNLTWCCFAWM